MRKEKMRQLRAQAMQEFENFGGPVDRPVVQVAGGYNHPNQLALDPYANMTGKAVVQRGTEMHQVNAIPSYDNTYNIKIINNDTVNDSLEVNLFNAFRTLKLPNNGNDPTNIVVQSKNVAYETILQTSMVNNFVVGECRIIVSDPSQLTEDLVITKQTSTGTFGGSPIDIAGMINPEYNNDKVVDLKNLDWLIDGDTGIRFNLLKGQNITLILKTKLRSNISNTLQGTPVVEAAVSHSRM
ncbi:hypothetical protein BKI52_33065 [marine bacterium AO1-C]|nr:hypothetical protein BKI52_33065 [marine bacterium AO1-C]